MHPTALTKIRNCCLSLLDYSHKITLWLQFQTLVTHMKTTILVLKILRLFTQTIPQPWQAAAAMLEEFTIRGSTASSTHPPSCYEKRLTTGQNSLLFMCTRQGPGRGRWRYLKETLERVDPQRLSQTSSAGTAPTATTWVTTTGKRLHYRLLKWV